MSNWALGAVETLTPQPLLITAGFYPSSSIYLRATSTCLVAGRSEGTPRWPSL